MRLRPQPTNPLAVVFLVLKNYNYPSLALLRLQFAGTALSVWLADYIETTLSLERGTINTRQGEPSPFAIPQQNFSRHR
jgi:hypothetical protein